MNCNRNELFGVYSISLNERRIKIGTQEKSAGVLTYLANARWYSGKTMGFVVTDLGANLSSTHDSFCLLLVGGEKPTLQQLCMECVKMR